MTIDPVLGRDRLAALPAAVERPPIAPDALRTGIVHLGLGAFSRAHTVPLTEAAMAATGDPSWGVRGVSLRSDDTAQALRPQDGLYTLLERGVADDRLRVVGALTGVDGPSDLDGTLAGPLVSAATRVVTLTITEKGYALDRATGGLDADNPAVRADLATPDRPRGPLGVLAETLRRRARAGASPIAIVSCDNLAANGSTLARLVAEYADRAGPAWAAVVRAGADFPSTTVDRIVPATTDADRDAVATALGMRDRWPVVAEPWSQWVITDRFPSGRPAWERSGAIVVGDVAPFERAKLRLLNGAHTALALLGQLVGLATIDRCVADPALRSFARALMADAAETLAPASGLDLARYADALLARFGNHRLPHRTAQISRDTSLKLGPRILAAIAERRARGLGFERHAVVLALWVRLLGGVDERGSAIAIDDPAAAAAITAGAGSDDPAIATGAALGVLGDAEAAVPAVRAEVARTLAAIRRDGARALAARAAGGAGSSPVSAPVR